MSKQKSLRQGAFGQSLNNALLAALVYQPGGIPQTSKPMSAVPALNIKPNLAPKLKIEDDIEEIKKLLYLILGTNEEEKKVILP